MSLDPVELYKKIKKKRNHYKEEVHCPLILKIMLDSEKGRISTFCTEVLIADSTFYEWVNKYELFRECYLIGKMFAREAWEREGLRVRDIEVPLGTMNHEFEYWKMIGWSRFGVSKNGRIKLSLNPDDAPNKHYAQLLKQASEGDFTAAEIKQLMEAINVGLNTHQVIALQKEIDQLKQDLATMQENANGHNPSAN